MTPAGSILFHARGRQTPDECGFWNRLARDLRVRHSELRVIAHHPPQRPITFDMRLIENGLDHAPEGPEPPHRIGDWTVDELVARERMWRGGGPHTDNHRRLAVGYYHAAFTETLDAAEPSLVVVWNGHHTQEIILRELARQRDVPVIWLERGPLPGTLHFDTEGVLGGSSIASSTRWSWRSGTEQSHWRTILNNYRASLNDSTWWPQPESLGADQLRARLRIPTSTTTVCFAGQVDRDVQCLLYSPLFGTNADAFAWLCDRLRRLHSPPFVVGKHHPKSDTAAKLYQSHLNGLEGAWTTSAALNDCIAACNRFAAVNSTTLFEAMLAGRPALSLGRSILAGKELAYEIDAPDDASDLIENWLTAADWEARQERFLDFCSYLLASELFASTNQLERVGLRSTRALSEYLLAHAESRKTSRENI